MPQAFHATLDAKSKRYRYVIDNGTIASPFQLRYSWHVPAASTTRRMDARRARSARPARLPQLRDRLAQPDQQRADDLRPERIRCGEMVTIEVEADGFLYNMVRSIAGTLVLGGHRQAPRRWVAEVLAAESRVEAGPTAPPQGLFLVTVRYES